MFRDKIDVKDDIKTCIWRLTWWHTWETLKCKQMSVTLTPHTVPVRFAKEISNIPIFLSNLAQNHNLDPKIIHCSTNTVRRPSQSKSECSESQWDTGKLLGSGGFQDKAGDCSSSANHTGHKKQNKPQNHPIRSANAQEGSSSPIYLY